MFFTPKSDGRLKIRLRLGDSPWLTAATPEMKKKGSKVLQTLHKAGLLLRGDDELDDVNNYDEESFFCGANAKYNVDNRTRLLDPPLPATPFRPLQAATQFELPYTLLSRR